MNPEHAEVTPEEAAAERRRQRRNHQTVFNLVIATIASLGIVLFLVLVVVRPDPAPRDAVDYPAIAEGVASSVDGPVVAPVLPPGWVANAARLETVAGVTTWFIGFVTPSQQFVAVNQGFDGNTSWQTSVLREARETGTTRVEGIEWTVYDRRDADDPGNHAYAMATETHAGTIVLHGTASVAEFETIATAITMEVR